MTERSQIYRCDVCGNIVEVLHAGAGKLVCCGEDMGLLKENTEDTGYEKHVPVIERDGDDVTVKVGSVAHPMDKEHYIEFIELIADGKVFRKHLNPGDKPEAEFETDAKELTAREYCTVHGLWKTK